MANHERHAEVKEIHVEEAPVMGEVFNEKSTAFNVQEVSVTTSSAASVTRRNESARRRITTIKQKPLDRFFKTCKRQSPFVKAFVATVISSIPFIIFVLVAKFAYPRDTKIDQQGTNATLMQLAKWLMICWGSFMGLLWCGRIFASFAVWACNQSQVLVKYQKLAEALCLRIVLMIWAIVIFLVIPRVFHETRLPEEKDRKDPPKIWVDTLREVFRFLIIAFALIVIQGIILQLSSILYIQGYMGPRSQRASDELNTIKQLHDLVDPKSQDDFHRMGKAIRKLLVPINENDPYYRISRGWGDPELWTEYAHTLWETISQGKTSIDRFDIDQQLRAMNRDTDRGYELFTQLDHSGDSEVTLDEVEKLVYRVGTQLNARDQAQHGIKRLLSKLEILLSIVMLAGILLLWFQFFRPDKLTDIKNFWTGLMGLSFAFAGVVSEFVNSCVFVFGRHPYDVGDYIEAKGKKLVVQKIFLTHTNFEEVTDPHERGVVVQSSHASLFTEPIINWTRTLEDVIEKKAVAAKADADKNSVKTEAETKATNDARELVQLKVEQLKGIKLEEKY